MSGTAALMENLGAGRDVAAKSANTIFKNVAHRLTSAPGKTRQGVCQGRTILWNASKLKRGIALKDRLRDIAALRAAYPLR
jgi:hypothetical protein